MLLDSGLFLGYPVYGLSILFQFVLRRPFTQLQAYVYAMVITYMRSYPRMPT